MEINHLFKLYHGVAEPMKIYIRMTVGGRIVQERAFA